LKCRNYKIVILKLIIIIDFNLSGNIGLKIELCCVLVFLTGCKSSVMMGVKPVDVATLDSNQTIVTFVRSGFVGKAIQFGIWDGEEWVGVLASDSYIQYRTEPGKHLFLARAENWSCIEADLEAGKSYFVIVRPRMGVWKARVAMDPVNKGDNVSEKKINKWLIGLKATAIDPAKSEAYINPRIEHVRKALENVQQGKAKCNTLSKEDYR
jgi:hypothetical protein